MGGSGGQGGRGGTGGSGGNAAKKRRLATETPQQRIARCEKRTKKNGDILSAQEATQRLNRVIYGTDEAEESALVEEKVELDLFLAAVVKAGGALSQQGKFLAVQSQFSMVGAVDIGNETDNRSIRKLHKDIESECAAIPLLRIQLTSLVPRSAAHVHKLETHAQRTLMMMTSYDPDSNVIQCYNASALPADGWSQLKPSLILAGGYKVLVITMTVYKGNLGVEAQPSLARNDFVFGPDGFKVSWLCTPIAMWVAHPEQGGCRCTVIN